MASKKKKKSFSEQLIGGEYKSSFSKDEIAPILKKNNESVTKAYKKEDDSLFGAFSDGYDFGDVTKTILTGGKKLGSTVYNTGKEVVTHPIQSIKTFGVGIGEGINTANDLINNATDDFFDWIVPGRKEKKDDDLSVNIINIDKFSKTATEEEKQKVLKEYEKKYGKDSALYKSVEVTLNNEDTSKKNILNAKYYDSDTYKDVKEGKLSKEQESIYAIGENVGAMLPSMAVSTINPALGTGVFFTQAQQGYTEEALERGYSEGEARTYGLIMGTAEVVIEKVSGKLGLGVDETGGFQKLSLQNLGKTAVGEGAEEFVIPYVDDVVSYVGYEDGYNWEKFRETSEEAVESAVMGATVGVIMSAGGRGLSKTDEVIQKINRGQEVTQADLVEAGREIQENEPELFKEAMSEVPTALENQLNVTSEDVALQSEEEIAPITEKILNGEVQQAGQQDIAPVVENSAEISAENAENVVKSAEVTQQDAKIEENASYTEQDLKTQHYVYEAKETDSDIVKTAKESATKVMNNTKRSHEFVETTSKMAERLGNKIVFTNESQPEMIEARNRLINRYAEKNNVSVEEAQERFKKTTLNGFVGDNGEIYVNVNSNKALNFIVGHETTHLFEGDKASHSNLVKFAKQYAETKGDLQERLDRAESVYRGVQAQIDNEITADIIGDYLFTDKAFIEQLSTEQPSIARRIFNEIKHWVKMATAGSKEARQLEQLKHAFEVALNKKSENKVSKVTVQETKTNSSVEVESNTQQMADTEFSLDSLGNELTEAQIEYFKDTKVLDKDGNLLVVYHGTKADFDTFDVSKAGQNYEGGWTNSGKGIYFTDSKAEAADFSEASEGGNTNLKEVYLNIKNPFDTSLDYRETLPDLLEKYNINPKYAENGVAIINELRRQKLDITEILKSYGYDGVIDYGHYLIYEPNQAKYIDNKNPSAKDDLRYSLDEDTGEMVDSEGNKVTLEASDVGNTNTLMAIHNLDADKLRGVLELNGFPVPSIAIVDSTKGNHTQFGTISVLFDKNTIDPENRKNEVYDRDVWSPTFPTVEYDIDTKVLDKIRKITNSDYGYDSNNKYLSEISSKLNNLEDKVNRGGIERTLEDIKNSSAFKYAYLKQINPNFKEVTKTHNYNYDYTNESLKRFLDSYNGETPLNELSGYDGTMELVPLIKEAVRPELEALYSKYGENGKVIIEEELKSLEKYNKADNFIYSALNMSKYGDSVQETDVEATKDLINDNINQSEYEKWVDETFKDIISQKGIRNDKDIFTPSGNRRSFKQLHDPYSLENIVKNLTKQKTVGGEKGFGVGSNFGTLQAQMSKRFNSIEEIKEYAKNRLTTPQESNSLLEPLRNAFYENVEQLSNYTKYDTGYSAEGLDMAGYGLNDFAKYKTQNLTNLKKALDENGIASDEVPLELLNKIVDDVNALKDIPTDYFEAKPQRAVGLDEVKAIIIPNYIEEDLTQEDLFQQFEDKGLSYYVYDPNIEGDRQRVINQFDDLKFSLSEETDNQGRQLSVGQVDKFKDSKARDDKGNIVTVYHTMTEEGQQFNEFIPMRDKYYRFGDQVVNFYTDSKEMSGSYANQVYRMADTSKLNSIEEVNEWLKQFDGSRRTSTGYVSDEVYKGRIVPRDGGAYGLEIETQNTDTGEWELSRTILFNDETDVLRNIKTEASFALTGETSISKFQYEGYVNITNPYEIDAEDRGYGNVSFGVPENIKNQLTRITDTEMEALTDLAQKSRDYHLENWSDKLSTEEFYLRNAFYKLTGIEQDQVIYSKFGNEITNPDKTIRIDMEIEEGVWSEREITLEDFARRYNEVKENYRLYHTPSSYFLANYKDIINTNKIEDIDVHSLFDIAEEDFSLDSMIDIFGERKSTNDIVFDVLEMNKNGSNYDGVIIKNVVDYGGYAEGIKTPADLYITFASNQFKAVDNLNPTDDNDIRYSLSEQDEDIAPIGDYNVYGNEVGLQQQVEEAIAPLQQQVQELTKVITDLQENIAPVSQDIVESEADRNLQSYTDEDAPINEGTVDFGEEAVIKGKREIYRELQDDFNIKHSEARELYNKIDSMVDPTTEEIFEVLQDYRNVKVTEEDSYYQEIKDFIKSSMKYGKLDASHVKAQIPDYNYFRMYSMGKGLILGNSGSSIDTFYNELSDMYPNTFPESITAEADQLERIVDVLSKDATLEYTDTIGDESLMDLASRIKADIGNKGRYDYNKHTGYFLTRDMQSMLGPGEVDNPIKTDPTYEEQLKVLSDLDEKYAPYIEQAREVNASNTENPSEMASVIDELNRLDEELSRKRKEAENETTIRRGDNPVEEIFGAYLDKLRNKDVKTVDNKVTKSKRRQFFDTAKRLFVNEMVETDNLAKETGNLNIKYTGDMFNSVAGEVEGEIYTAQTDNEGREVGKSLTQLFSNSKEAGLYEAFNHYLELQSNIDRHKQGKGSLVPLEESVVLVKEYEKSHPEFKAWGKDIWNYGKNIRNNLVDAGLITEEFSNTLGEMYPHYVPYIENRDPSNFYPDLGELKPVGVIKRAKGGANNLLPIEDALMKYTFASKKAVRQNQFYQQIVNTLEDKVSIGADVRDNATDLSESLYRDETGNYLTAYIDGKQQSVRISDDLYKGLKNDLAQQVKDLESKMSLITDPVQKLSEIRRNLLTTWSPSFIIRNPIMDIQDATFNSKYTRDFMKHYPKAFSELASKNDPLARQFLTLYGSGNNMGEFSADGTKRNDIKGLKGIAKVNNIVELAPRYAEFRASLDNGATIQEAMYNAREVTTNFSRGGTITKALNKNGFTFLNVSVQGFDKFIRNFSGENGAKGVANSLLKSVMLGVLPALFNDLAFGGDEDEEDEDYKALPDYIKDNYYLIKVGDDGEFIRIPKGRILSVFGSASRRALEYMQGEEDAFEGFLKNAYSQIGVSNPLDSNILTPILQAYGSENGEAWYGGDLVPSRLQDKAPEEQYDASTDKFSIWLGEQLGISPYKLNYVLDQYTGGIGDIFLPMITEESTSDAEGLGTLIAPIKSGFTANSTDDNKYASEIYTLSDKMDKLPSATKETDEYKIQDSYLYSVTSEMAKLYQERRDVQADTSLSKKEKYEKVQSIQKQINSLAKEGLDNYENVSKTDNYAIVGGREFNKYTTDDGEVRWGKVYDNVLDDMNSMGMDLEEKSEYFTATNKISEIRSNYDDTDDYTGKKKATIDVIKGTNLNDEQKAYIYDKYYADTDTLDAIVTLGMDFDTYLDYESQEFTADKDSNGKTINNSKKNKVFDYINSTNLKFEEKVILAKLQYNSYDEYNYEIIDYLNNSDLTYEQEATLLKKLGFKVDENGTITW